MNILLALMVVVISWLGIVGGAGHLCPSECDDTPPPPGPKLGSAYTCEEQKEFGQCGSEFMTGFCECTCLTCPSLLDMLDGPEMEDDMDSMDM